MASDRIRLRPLRTSDAPLLYEWITDRNLVILNSAYYPIAEQDHESWVSSMMLRRSDRVFFVIEEIETGSAIGSCQLLKIDARHRHAELQIRIGDARARGKGLGSEAVEQLCRFGFRDLNLHRIHLEVFATNVGAVKAYEKCAFRHEGRMREAAFIDGAWVDILLMARLAESQS